MKSAIVVGAGINGVLSAYYLQQAGYQVTVIDQHAHPAMECSRANGGQVSVCNSATWNTLSNVMKGVKWFFDPQAPLKIGTSPSLAKITWLAGFLRHTVNGTQRDNTIKTVELGLRSRDLYRQIAQQEGLQFKQANCGLLNLYTSEASMQAAIESSKVLTYAGLDIKPVSRDEILQLDPNLRDFRNIVGGLHTPADFVGDAHLFTKHLLQVITSRGGWYRQFKVDTVQDGVVSGWDGTLDREIHMTADVIVLANGYRLKDLAGPLGDFLNIYPVKGYSITIDLPERHHAPALSLLDDDRKIVCSTLGNQLRVAGTAELADDNLDIRRERIEPLLNWVATNFPQVDHGTYLPWACLRPMASDMMPITRRSTRYASVWYNGGHGHLGWTLGAATAKQLVEMITEA
jgi:D-amino-acid dehydrogenase